MPAREVVIQTASRALAARALEKGFHQFLVEKELPGLGHVESYRLRGDDILLEGKTVGRRVLLATGADQAKAEKEANKAGLVLIEATDWKVIPLENLVARLDGHAKVWAQAASPSEARTLFATLERGIEGVVVRPKNAQDLDEYASLLEGDVRPLALVTGHITRIEAVGVGERVCVDTCSLLSPKEGFLVGSTSAGFFLVASEAKATEFVNARPFRVNAGAIHSYLWNGDRTHYLSEVVAGMPLEAVDARGRRRRVIVGRSKVETRPLVLVVASHKDGTANVILQNAETIRILQPGGRAVGIDRLRVGDPVLIHPESGARHTGIRIQERLRET